MSSDMVFAPIIIPTLNRYEHLKRCVDSLSKCTHAENTELIIGLDYPPTEKYRVGWERINNYLQDITGFKKVTIIRADHNLGVVNNTGVITSYALKRYDAYIFSEDDNEFSPCFLDYMNKALRRYWDDDRVSAICGYSFPIDMKSYPHNVYFYHDQSAWGIARWKHKAQIITEDYKKELTSSFKTLIKLYRADSRLFFLLLSMKAKGVFWEDALRGIYNVLSNKLVLYPTISMCRNYGHDGTGVNCGETNTDDRFMKQRIDTRTVFDIDDIEISCCNEKSLRKYFHISFKERMVYIKQYINYLFKNA